MPAPPDDDGTPAPPHPLLDTTYTLHRLSPLHSFPPLKPTTLAPHAKVLLSQLRGAVLRGIRIADDPLGDAQLSRAGALKSITWLPLPPLVAGATPAPIGVRIELRYETITYSALLLGGVSRVRVDGAFTHLPLLLCRMPRAPREALESYLTTTFDATVRPLALPPAHLRSALDGWVAAVEGRTKRELVLAFAPPAGVGRGLRTMTVTVQGEEVRRFWKRGEGSVWRALETYWCASTGVEIGGMRVVKVATGWWVMAEGKCKFVPPADGMESVGGRALVEMVERLVEAARVGGKEVE
ncbi:kinetochore complex Sim4 subunit Fta1-domain-containing protein [Geopyxis carbonaria]|nr:kinetochore complex Sim4 subunit Fta1-domain-containing protein [Geopyxis carbonaria]